MITLPARVVIPTQSSCFLACPSRSHETARHSSLLSGYEIHLTPSLKPDREQMTDIIKCSGGEAFNLVSPVTPGENVIIVSCENDLSMCKESMDAGVPVHSAELILGGVLRQELDLKSYPHVICLLSAIVCCFLLCVTFIIVSYLFCYVYCFVIVYCYHCLLLSLLSITVVCCFLIVYCCLLLSVTVLYIVCCFLIVYCCLLLSVNCVLPPLLINFFLDLLYLET